MFASLGFSSSYGAQFNMTGGSSFTVYQVTGSQRGLIFLDTGTTNASSTVAYFATTTGVNPLSVLARNGNALGSQNLGTATSGAYNMNAAINASGAIRVSATTFGSVRWNVILLSTVV